MCAVGNLRIRTRFRVGALYLLSSVTGFPKGLPLVLAGLLVWGGIPLSSAADAVVLEVQEGSGPGWVWIVFKASPPGSFELSFEAHNVSAPAAFGAQSVVSFIHANPQRSRLRAEFDESQLARVELTSVTAGAVDAPSYIKGPIGSRPFAFLGWIAGNTTGWSLELAGSSHIEVLELATGSTSFLFTNADFPSQLAFEAYVERPGGRVQKNASLDRSFTGAWVGTFDSRSVVKTLGFNEPATSLVWSPPEGEPKECPCTFFPPSWHGFPHGARGTNRFSFNSVSAGDSMDDEIYLTGVDFGSFRSVLWP